MSEPDPCSDPDRESESGPGPEPGREPRRLTERERRRLAEVFGDVLPATTADERDDRDRAGEPDPDDDLMAERPPHHDRER